MCTEAKATSQRKAARGSLSIRLRVNKNPYKNTLTCHDGTSKSPQKAMHIDQLPHPVSTDDSTASSFHTAADEEGFFTDSDSNILDDYEVFPKVLGSGHYGSVRECIHRTTRQVFAVKSIDKSKVTRHDHLQCEVSLLREMNHDGIMKMVDCYDDSEFVHIVTEKYSGGELFDKIVENTSPEGCFSEARAARIMKSLLEAVHYLHQKGIVHRDIKPENILFESKFEDSDVKLIDFGLSRKHRKGDASMTSPVGTAYYMSPEVINRKYDKSCDIWSLGIVSYVLMCGYPPFNGDSDADIYDSIRRGHLGFTGYGWGGASEGAKDFIKCMLHRDPRKRFTAVEALQHPWLVENLQRLY